MSAETLAAIPSPTWSGFDIGPLTIHAYALCIILGIVAALWLTNRRWKARGGSEDDLWAIAMWAIPAGIIGGRIYHVISTPRPYFGENGDPVAVLYIWNGGLGIWGAVVLGVLVSWWAARRHRINIAAFVDAAAPGLLLAQAIGRWGNWFNQELFGAPTTLPWGLRIDRTIDGVPNPNWPGPEYAEGTLFHPTFLYESLWNLAGVLLLLWLHRRFRLAHGQVFLLYVCYYTLGRVWIEMLRIDTAELILGVRLNVWVSILVFLAGAVCFVLSVRRHRGAPDEIYLPGRDAYDAALKEKEKTPAEGPAAARTAEQEVEDVEDERPAVTSGEEPGEGTEDGPRFGDHGAVTSKIRIVPIAPEAPQDVPQSSPDTPAGSADAPDESANAPEDSADVPEEEPGTAGEHKPKH